MPSTLWAAPVPNLSFNSLTVSSFTTATKTDLSPAQVVLWPGMYGVGTRIRLRAYGNYTATTTASTLVWGFYMNSTATNNITTTPAILAESSSTAAVVLTNAPWMLEWEGQFRALTSPLVGATNAQIFGQGKAFVPLTISTFTMTAIPITAALRTVQQTATGLVTNIPQTVMVGLTVGTNTGFTSATCDELTCELLG